MEFFIFILVGAFAGGFVNGLSGFGTSMTALAFWLYVVPPTIAAPLAVTCSLVGHLQTMPSIWRQINLKRVMPFILAIWCLFFVSYYRRLFQILSWHSHC